MKRDKKVTWRRVDPARHPRGIRVMQQLKFLGIRVIYISTPQRPNRSATASNAAFGSHGMSG
jgi:hypothetical protein